MRNALVPVLLALSAMATSCATASTARQAPAVDVTGRWTGTMQAGAFPISVTLDMKQVSADVTGNLVVRGTMEDARFSGALTGTVEGNTLQYSTQTGGGADLTVNGDEMSGVTRAGFRLALRRQR